MHATLDLRLAARSTTKIFQIFFFFNTVDKYFFSILKDNLMLSNFFIDMANWLSSCITDYKKKSCS